MHTAFGARRGRSAGAAVAAEGTVLISSLLLSRTVIWRALVLAGILCLIPGILLFFVGSAVPASELDIEANFKSARSDVVAFYNVYADKHKHVRGTMDTYKTAVNDIYNIVENGRELRAIVREQIKKIESTGLYDRLDKIFYVTVGRYRSSLTASDFSLNEKRDGGMSRSADKYIHLAHYTKEAGEVQTLSYLQRFCGLNPASKVLYFHNKGSYHPSPRNDLFRSQLNNFVLNPRCLSALQDHDTCGWRISPVPTVHYSGNFWWARCEYINKLVDPLSQLNNATFRHLSKQIGKAGCLYDRERYFAETWLGSAPTIHPADCMNTTVESEFLFGNGLPPNVPEWAGGLPCSTASSYSNPKVFKEKIDKVRDSVQADCDQSWLSLMRQRSLLWYGQEPSTVVSWMARLDA